MTQHDAYIVLYIEGCRAPGYYGLNCIIPCPDSNCRYSDLQRGTCQGCKHGYQGHYCELCICLLTSYLGIALNEQLHEEVLYLFIILLPECDGGHYGEGCQDQCGHCADITNCHHVNDTCLNGCERGYMGSNCKTGNVYE